MKENIKGEKVRMFCDEVRRLAKTYDLPFFLVTDGASATDNNGCEAVKNARLCHVKWEKAKGFNPNEDWSIEKKQMDDKNKRWNNFVNDICISVTNYKDIQKLNKIKKNAILCFWYYSEMNSGGHSGFFDVYSDVDLKELFNSLVLVGADEYANNLEIAIKIGIDDDYEQTDTLFYNLEPDLGDILQEYVETNKDDIF